MADMAGARDAVRAGKYVVPILYLDNHLLAVVKPPNLPVQADASGDPDLLSILKAHVAALFHKPGAAYLGLIHRLDRPVGGVMVFARTSKAAARLCADFAGQAVVKQYLAVAQGRVAERAELSDYLLKDPKTGMVRRAAQDEQGAKLARLLTEPLAAHADARGETTLLRVTLYTGRPHQIRVQHLLAGHPLWGDCRYGHGAPGQQIALWSASLTLAHPTQKTRLRFEAPPPAIEPFTRYAKELEALP